MSCTTKCSQSCQLLSSAWHQGLAPSCSYLSLHQVFPLTPQLISDAERIRKPSGFNKKKKKILPLFNSQSYQPHNTWIPVTGWGGVFRATQRSSWEHHQQLLSWGLWRWAASAFSGCFTGCEQGPLLSVCQSHPTRSVNHPSGGGRSRVSCELCNQSRYCLAGRTPFAFVITVSRCWHAVRISSILFRGWGSICCSGLGLFHPVHLHAAHSALLHQPTNFKFIRNQKWVPERQAEKLC